MAFKFNFIEREQNSEPAPASSSSHYNVGPPFREIPLAQLIEKLPPVITYSTPNNATMKNNLARRNVWDIRFQLASESDVSPEWPQNGENGDSEDNLADIDASTDLIPGTYEGGLKTWECSEDLVDILDANYQTYFGWGKRAIEVGCGSAMPSCFLFTKLLSCIKERPQECPETAIHFTDFNEQVLSLVTLPNILLAYALFLASQNDDTQLTKPTFDDSTLHITETLIEQFTTLLQHYNISLRFYSGSWSSQDIALKLPPTAYDLVTTSETIYNIENLPSLIKFLCHCTYSSSPANSGTCLVAFKIAYFGVGGSEYDFTCELEKQGGRVAQVVDAKSDGVGRKIVRVQW